VDGFSAGRHLGRDRGGGFSVNGNEPLLPTAQVLLQRLGLGGPCEIEALPGGRNNCVWRLRTDGHEFLLKKYYWAEDDRRNRMGHEWAFLLYLQGIGCARAPRPLVADPSTRCALLEFVRGCRPQLSEVTVENAGAAADFFGEMNAGRFSEAGRALPLASEACFSLEEHLATTERRVVRLGRITPEDEAHREAISLVNGQIVPVWEKVRGFVLAGARGQGGADRTLDPQERCLSPSDFGFHNSLRQPDGTLRFVDFEYAGWDDPAKTVADFANQPDMLLEARLSDVFQQRALALFAEPGRLAARVRLLTPLYQVKWACICLNEFLPIGSSRRAFTGLRSDEGITRLSGHLERARLMGLRAAASLAAGC
jgi:hypothetical protein